MGKKTEDGRRKTENEPAVVPPVQQQQDSGSGDPPDPVTSETNPAPPEIKPVAPVKPVKPVKKSIIKSVDAPPRIVCPSCLCADYDVLVPRGESANKKSERRRCRGCGFKYKATW